MIHTARHRITVAAALAGLAALLSGCAIGGGGAASVDASSDPAFAHCDEVKEAKYQYYDGNIINMQVVVAEKAGLFTENCLKGTPVRFNNTPSSVSGTVAGEVDFINTGTDNVPAFRTEGIDLKIVANNIVRPFYSLVVAPDSMGDTYEATLANLQTVGVVTVGASNEYHGRLFFEDTGVDPDAVTWIGMGDTPSMLAGLENGTVDAVVYFGTAQDIAVAQGFGVFASDPRKESSADNPVPASFAALGPASLVWAAQGTFIDQNPEVVEHYAATMTAAGDWIRDPANREQLYEFMADELSVPDSLPDPDQVVRDAIDIYANIINGTIDMETVQNYIDFAVETRGLTLDETAEDMVWGGQS